MERRPGTEAQAPKEPAVGATLRAFAERFGTHLAGWVAAISKIDAREDHSRLPRQRLEAEYPPTHKEPPLAETLRGFAERFGTHLAGWATAVSKIDARENHSRLSRQRLEAEYPARR